MTMKSDATLFLGEAWFDPIEAGIREQIRGFIEGLIEEELTAALGRGRYERRHRRGSGDARAPEGAMGAEMGDVAAGQGSGHGQRKRRVLGAFGTVEIVV